MYYLFTYLFLSTGSFCHASPPQKGVGSAVSRKASSRAFSSSYLAVHISAIAALDGADVTLMDILA